MSYLIFIRSTVTLIAFLTYEYTCSVSTELSGFIICENSNTDPIDRHCSNGAVININTSIGADRRSSGVCPTINEIPDISEAMIGIQCQKEIPLLSCHGSRQCALLYTQVEHALYCSGHYESDLLYVRYTCYQFIRRSTLLFNTNSTDNESGRGIIVDLLSPNFPCEIQNVDYDAICGITYPSDYVRVTVVYKFIKFGSVSNETDELSFLKNGLPVINITVEGSTGAQQQNDVHTIQLSRTDKFEMKYTKHTGQSGGKFWIQLSGTGNEKAVEMEVKCTTSSDRVNAVLGDSCRPFVTTEFAVTPVHEGGDSDDFPLGAVVGAAMGFVVVLLLIAIGCYFYVKRSKDHGQSTSLSTATNPSGRASNIYVSGVNDPTAVNENQIENGHLTSDISVLSAGQSHTQEHGQANSVPLTEMYATVNKAVKQRSGVFPGDETVMTENTELYEASNITRDTDVQQSVEQEKDEVIYDNSVTVIAEINSG